MKRILLIAIIVVAAILVFICGIFGSTLVDRLLHNRFVNIEATEAGSEDIEESFSYEDDANQEDSETTGTDEVADVLETQGGETFIKISEIPDMQMLLHLLNQVRFSYGEAQFTNAESQRDVNVIQHLVAIPNCVHFEDYDIAQPYETSSDPRGYLNGKYAGFTCQKIPESSVVWVAKNILHLSDETIDYWTDLEEYFYCEDGYYYSFMGGIGDDFHYPEIIGAKVEDDIYYIYYNYVGDPSMFGYSGDYDYANVMKAAYEKADGYYYWTIYDEKPLREGAITYDYVYGDDWADYADVSGVYDWNSVQHPFAEKNKPKQEEVKVETASSSGKSGSGENAPFYGLWIGAWSNKDSAEQQADQARAYGYDACVLLSSDWDNLNPDPYYVVTTGRYSSEAAAEKELSFVQKNIIDQAYVKYSGNHK